MKFALALAFLAVANAAYPVFDDVVVAYDELAPISPMWTKAMFSKYGFAKPAFDSNFVSFARSMGVSDYPAIGHLHALYDEPAVLFFSDATGGMVSFYADAGIESAMHSPMLKAVFPSVLGAADSMAIAYHPESFMGAYKTVLPGHFFMPSNSAPMAKFMRSGVDAFPMPIENVIFQKSEIAELFPEVSPIFARFDIEEFPFAYKNPVAITLFDNSAKFLPSTFSKSAFPAVSPFSAIATKAASPVVDEAFVPALAPAFAPAFAPTFAPAFAPAISAAASPAFSRAYIPASTPAFSAAFTPAYSSAFAPASSPALFKSAYSPLFSDVATYPSAFVPALKFPMMKHIDAYEPLVYAKPSFKVMPYAAKMAAVAPIATVSPISTVAPIAAAPVASIHAADLTSPVADELRAFNPFAKAFHAHYPSFYPRSVPASAFYPALRYPAPFFAAPTATAAPIVPVAAGATTSSIASAHAAAAADPAAYYY